MNISFNKLSFWLINLVLTVLMLLVISLILLAAKTNPLTFLDIIFIEPWKNLSYFSGFLHIFSILLLIGLAAAITFKYKIYNFGIAGQMLFSALVTFIVGTAISDAGGTNRVIVIFLLLITILAGAFSGFLIAILKNYFKINEIISTVLFNFIAWQGYKGVLASPSYQNKAIAQIFSLRFSLTSGPFNNSNLFSAGIILAIAIFLITIFFFSNRIFDFKLTVFSKNQSVAKQARINPNPENLKILIIAGAIAGFAGYLLFLATNNHLPEISGIPQYGFYGVVIGALVFYQLLLIPISTFIFTLFIRPIEFDGFIYLSNPGLAVIIVGVAIYLMGIFPLFCYLWQASPKIQENWLKFKRKLFKLATPIEAELNQIKKTKPTRSLERLQIDLEPDKQGDSNKQKLAKKAKKDLPKKQDQQDKD
ncbi:MAG: hypothetical protein REH79_01730 [Spiroplasma sp.]|nr:hypothetical protein [Spiroplasma sp.]